MRRLLLLPFVLFVGVTTAQSDSANIVADSAVDTAVVQEPKRAELRDTLDWRQRHSPHKATLLSAVLPGAGQIYNRKYWKAPIAWLGLGTCVYFIQENTREYRRYKDAYIALVDGDASTIDEFNGQFSPSQVLEVTDTYRRWRDLSYIAFGLVYMLNVVDATVDAHFVRFDVGSDLSLRAAPAFHTTSLGAPGLTLALTYR
ncbi:MAG: DUF5683 domain-containing protein [Flavobacteriales bacterium]